MIERVVKECLGVPYVHGGRDLTGFDCLGLVWYFNSLEQGGLCSG